jgi:hypothetical protein
MAVARIQQNLGDAAKFGVLAVEQGEWTAGRR